MVGKLMMDYCKVKIVIGGTIAMDHVQLIAATIADEHHKSVKLIVSEIEYAAEKNETYSIEFQEVTWGSMSVIHESIDKSDGCYRTTIRGDEFVTDRLLVRLDGIVKETTISQGRATIELSLLYQAEQAGNLMALLDEYRIFEKPIPKLILVSSARERMAAEMTPNVSTN